MWQIIVYALAISAALGLLGFANEKLNPMPDKSRRLAWTFTMAVSILWPLAAMLWNQPAAITMGAPVEQSPAVQPLHDKRVMPSAAIAPALYAQPARTEQLVSAVREPAPAARPKLQPPSDRAILLAWAAVSGALLLCFAGAELLLRRRASRWQRQTILGSEVWISESTGPALLGALRPAIVVPQWFVDESATTQSLILQHEQQHIAARDPLLLRLALLIVVAMPWNLPLWWQLRRLRQAIELDCDARVLRAGVEPDSYGKVLLAVTQRASAMPIAAIAMSEPASALERRIRSLAAGPARFSVPRALAAVALWGVGFGAAFSVEAPAIPVRAKEPARVAASAPAAQAPTPTSAPVLPQAPQPAAAPPRASASQPKPAAGAQDAAAANDALLDITKRLVAAEQKLQELRQRFNDNYPGVKLQMQIIETLKKEEEQEIARRSVLAGTPPGTVRKPWQPLQAATPATRSSMELRELIAQTADMFKKRFVIDPNVRGTVDIGALNPDLLSYHAFLEILGVNGFVAVPSGDVVTIIPSTMARTVASPIVRADRIVGDEAEVVTVLIPIVDGNDYNTSQLASTLRSLIANWGVLNVTNGGKSLLLVDKVANARRIVALVRGQPEEQ